jgi:peptidoglycan/LPS O-acetylase OafA/YrhL
MNPLSPLLVLPILIVALAICALLLKFFGAPSAAGRYATLDGLRGYLALGVFMHHGSIWYFYLHTGQWTVPPSKFYIHLGQSSVAMFFMITAFLFLSKLLDARHKEIDWVRLMMSRILRLWPLYLFAMLLMLAMVAWLSGGTLRVPPTALLQEITQWLSFTVFGAPDLNDLPGTGLITAGVTWSLVYEWCFYLALPLIALLVGHRVPLPWLGLSIVCVTAFLTLKIETRFLDAFLGGIAASLFARHAGFRSFAASRFASVIAFACAAMAALRYSTAYEHAPMLLLAICFILLAAGNDMFGILTHPASRMLGEMTYGIYLLHGMLLFFVFRVLVGDAAVKMSVTGHWLLLMSLTPPLLLICYACFRWIEAPAMRGPGKLLGWLRMRKI